MKLWKTIAGWMVIGLLSAVLMGCQGKCCKAAKTCGDDCQKPCCAKAEAPK